ncbi:MAG: hypothetical protein E5X86_26580 [Mesorhizobium sp.]|uniref:hypothetical protein n=1 Tax=Mesorhizobium sp. TaxID=1871066 RepID=UPI000FE6BEA7|nr:hypothetical protein [Mesorhizobium sp.]RWJ00544.1 MAG: hypothetical protein EOR23_28505 [Mesorhizobium sp.]RWK94500.1 MAG: hypothetical protein EOR53_17980 [Mesorhizobium sp.]TIO14019.1 MAG: hypothetical protein E5X86_26580 [Mesorhizobium sp.]TIP24852.1 MAG: hypothetical protein E5X67_27140 [Mesorhizobium sp.]TIQ18934.1 MAG: hypothetical protein E5X51_23730 [Mesorhizobium sp.]
MTATQKPTRVRRKIDGKIRFVPADTTNQTETPEATIRRLAEEVKKFSDWWHEDRRKVERLELRLRALEGTLRAISNLARIETGDFVERCDRGGPYDDHIPF